jgi:hypothetical protein
MRVSITMTLIKTQNAMRRDSRDAGKRNSSFTDITSSPEYLGELSIKAKNQRPPAEVAWAPSRGHPHTPSSAGGR